MLKVEAVVIQIIGTFKPKVLKMIFVPVFEAFGISQPVCLPSLGMVFFDSHTLHTIPVYAAFSANITLCTLLL